MSRGSGGAPPCYPNKVNPPPSTHVVASWPGSAAASSTASSTSSSAMNNADRLPQVRKQYNYNRRLAVDNGGKGREKGT